MKIRSYCYFAHFFILKQFRNVEVLPWQALTPLHDLNLQELLGLITPPASCSAVIPLLKGCVSSVITTHLVDCYLICLPPERELTEFLLTDDFYTDDKCSNSIMLSSFMTAGRKPDMHWLILGCVPLKLLYLSTCFHWCCFLFCTMLCEGAARWCSG